MKNVISHLGENGGSRVGHLGISDRKGLVFDELHHDLNSKINIFFWKIEKNHLEVEVDAGGVDDVEQRDGHRKVAKDDGRCKFIMALGAHPRRASVAQ